MTETFNIFYQSVFIEEDHLSAATLLSLQETLEREGDHPEIEIYPQSNPPPFGTFASSY